MESFKDVSTKYFSMNSTIIWFVLYVMLFAPPYDDGIIITSYRDTTIVQYKEQ